MVNSANPASDRPDREEGGSARSVPDAALLRFARRAYAAMDPGPALPELAEVFASLGTIAVALASETTDELRADLCVMAAAETGFHERAMQQVREHFPASQTGPAPHLNVCVRSGAPLIGALASGNSECWGTMPIRLPDRTAAYSLHFAATDQPVLNRTLRLAVEVHDMLAVILEAVERMKELATRDALTGLLNRRGLDEQYPRMWSQCRRAGQAISVLMMDLDSLKAINDAHGHPAGDDAICKLAAVLKSSLRAQDLVARYGGDEMCIVLPATTPEEARVVSDRLLRTIAACRLDPPCERVGISVSMGIAGDVPRRDEDSPSRLLHESDQALLEAKRGGGNRVCIHGPRANSASG